MLLETLLSENRKWVLEEPGVEAMAQEITSLSYDSRRVTPGSLFFAVTGLQTDGHLYLEEVRRREAAVVVSERKPLPDFALPWVRVDRIRPFMARLADRFYDHPSRRLRMIGITGTNGKTTTALLLHSILSRSAPSLLMGTIESRIGNRVVESVRTTPEAIDIQRTLAEGLEAGCRRGVMEVSSHALAFDRVLECRFPVAVFTNLSQDHLDFHGTFESYFAAKRRLFSLDYNPGLESAVLNAEDHYASRVETDPRVRRVTFGLSPGPDVFPEEMKSDLKGSFLRLRFLGRILELESGLLGPHNVANVMAAAAAASIAGIPDEQIRAGVRSVSNVPGRFERVEVPAPFAVIVDYAHTPHALENILRLCRSLTGSRVLCVFGCGGDRDQAKRPQMGAIAARHADLTIVTSDNPRSEDPEEIVRQIVAGIPATGSSHEVVVDRRAAVARALELARPGDVLLIAGKGHETYQELDGRRIHFDDRKVVRELT